MSLFNTTSYPLLQNTPRERRALFCKSGKMCAVRTFSGRPGMGRIPVCVEVMVLPSGSDTVIGLFVALGYRCGVLLEM